MMMQDNTHDASAGQLELYTYNPGIGFFSGQNVGTVGDNVNFIGCANLFGNGATQMVASDSSWQAGFGPIREGDNQAGETYDARLELPGWNDERKADRHRFVKQRRFMRIHGDSVNAPRRRSTTKRQRQWPCKPGCGEPGQRKCFNHKTASSHQQLEQRRHDSGL